MRTGFESRLGGGRGWFACLLLLSAVLAGDSRLVAQTQFRLTVPADPALSSAAVLNQQSLIITDAQGVTYRYQRAAQFDSPDGQLIGFYSRDALQALRWPASGSGAMQIGDAQGVNWRLSAQPVTPIAGGPAGPVIRPLPTRRPTPLPSGPSLHPAGPPQLPELNGGWGAPGLDFNGFNNAAGIGHIGVGVDRGDQPLLASIHDPLSIQLYQHANDTWRHQLDIRGSELIPGATILVRPDVVPGQPLLYTVDNRGSLQMISAGRGSLPHAPQIRLAPGAPLGSVAGSQVATAIDANGRLWLLDLRGQSHALVDETVGLFHPGSYVQLIEQALPDRSFNRQAYGINNRGLLVRYQQLAGQWSPPQVMAEGFVPGSPLSSIEFSLPGQGMQTLLAAVDWNGRLQLMTVTGLGMSLQPIDTGTLPPGGHVTLYAALDGPHLAGVGADGIWRDWMFGGGGWTPSQISVGFAPGAPVCADPLNNGLLAIDVRGQLVPAHYHQGAWQCRLCGPGYDISPRLISRRVVPRQPLPPAQVLLTNSGRDDVIVQIADALNPAASRDISVPAGGALPVQLERDSGGVIEETYMVPGPAGDWYEQTQQFPLPPQPRYSLAVWEGRVTYSYIDKRKDRPKGAVPSFDVKNHVSVGVFDLPPGDLLSDGTTIDVYQAARWNRNPGAAGHFGRPHIPPQTVPRE
ncbi:MAG: hypothetical protein R3B90_21050 [Planctomycetaceae bacterium]